MGKVSIVLCALALLAVVFSGAEVAANSNCDNALDLMSPCLNEYKKPAPSAACCAKTHEHVSCFCGYMQSEDLKRVFDRIEIRKMAKMCGVTFPSC
ncbi:Tracheary Element Differentiation-related 4 [Hibiscus trionum]|uniref:Tracheary Element Differentiation-related 4 n=1 Tax=Hibiscus trionum TaxID=183268 RepID=A0A9W7H5V9_HIBTR|nr:Tracheary Element Differentiation-related 4 [Hibiscus trionum]